MEVSTQNWPLSATMTWLVAVVTLYVLAAAVSGRAIDPREPPVIAPRIPFLGHLSMVFNGSRYVKNLGLQNKDKPIFTLPILTSRVYVVTDPSLAAAVQRASKVLSFTPLIPGVTERVLGLDSETMQIVRRNLEPGRGEERGYLADIQDMVYAWFGPGSYLTELTLDACHDLRDEVADYAALLQKQQGGETHQEVDLLHWIRHFVTVATAKYLYGPENPIALEPELEDAFWDFDHGLAGLLLGVLPSFTAGKAYSGRERLVEALVRYLEEGRHKTGSRIIKKRVELALEHGWTMPAAARSELSFLFAGIVNATTATFWIVLRLYADPALLATVRAELQAVLRRRRSEDDDEGGNDDDDDDDLTLAIHDLRDNCPTLVAVYRECLRLGSDNNSTRVVKEDTLLADQYFLKKDSVVQIAGGVIHADESIWGPDVNAFKPERFLSNNSKATTTKDKDNSNSNNIHPAAFRAFGGGKTICPGRHFAMYEILAFAAAVVLQFDVRSAEGKGGGPPSVPAKDDGVLPVHILEPQRPVKVVVSKRQGQEPVGLVDVRKISFTMESKTTTTTTGKS